MECDTVLASLDLGAYSSRLTLMGGNAVRMAAQRVKGQLFDIAARELGCDAAALVAGLPVRSCVTEELPLHGWVPREEMASGWEDPLHPYGAERGRVAELIASDPTWALPLHPRLPYLMGQVVWAARMEMARTLEDVLARRTRSLLLDARASVAAAPGVAAVLAGELGRDEIWAARQVEEYTRLAKGYLPVG